MPTPRPIRTDDLTPEAELEARLADPTSFDAVDVLAGRLEAWMVRSALDKARQADHPEMNAEGRRAVWADAVRYIELAQQTRKDHPR